VVVVDNVDCCNGGDWKALDVSTRHIVSIRWNARERVDCNCSIFSVGLVLLIRDGGRRCCCFVVV